MKFKTILSRLTGLSCPIFGISWNPSESEVTIATRIIRYLEDKRVLFNPSEMESPSYCVKSTIQIREYLTSEMQNMNTDSKLFEFTKAMRIAARKFIDRMVVEIKILCIMLDVLIIGQVGLLRQH